MTKRIGLVLVIALMCCSMTAHARRKGVVRVPAGTSIPKYALGVDVSYDPRFDTLVPGYKMLQVALVNNSFHMIALDPKKDKWIVRTTEGRKKYNAIADLRLKDPRAWNTLSPEVQNKISYPLILVVGARQVIDLFVPDSAPMETFTQLDIVLKGLPERLEVMARD